MLLQLCTHRECKTFRPQRLSVAMHKVHVMLNIIFCSDFMSVARMSLYTIVGFDWNNYAT